MKLEVLQNGQESNLRLMITSSFDGRVEFLMQTPYSRRRVKFESGKFCSPTDILDFSTSPRLGNLSFRVYDVTGDLRQEITTQSE